MESPSTSRLPRSPLFTPIPEQEKEEEEKSTPNNNNNKKKTDNNRQLSVYLNKCRPSPRDIFPLDQYYETTPHSKTLLHSLFPTLTLFKKTPKRTPTSSSASPAPTEITDWKLVAHDLSLKLLHVSRRRDEAVLEASRLKRNVSSLELKLKEITNTNADVGPTYTMFAPAVSNARKAVRMLTRALSGQIRPMRIATVLKLPIPNTGTLLVYVEALLNRMFYNGFEAVSVEESRILDPGCRAELNRKCYEAVRDLSWEQVLVTGTKHYSEELSKFCDEKMGEIVSLFGWVKEWPENLLAAFFAAAKGVWVVRLLGRCVYPTVTIMRVESGVGYDGKYMEDVIAGEGVSGGGAVTISPVSVKVMVAPGFYLWKGSCGVVKCKVVCGYSDSENCKLKKCSD